MAETAIRTAGRGPALPPPEECGREVAFDIPRFGWRFVPFCLISYIAASMLPDTLMYPVSRLTAAGAAALLDLSGMRPAIDGTCIVAGGFKADVIPECTPLFMVLLLCSFVLATPAPIGKKGVALLCGIPFLTMLNLVRIALVVMTGARFPSLFEYIHVYLGQIVMIFAVFAVCLVWFRYATAASPFYGIVPFFVRFAALSGLLFFPWLTINKRYVLMGDNLVRAFFALFGYQLQIDYKQQMYYQTFNLVGFAALMVASRSLPPAGRTKGLISGLAILCAAHVLIRVCNVLLLAFQVELANKLSLVLSVAGDFLLPVLLWMLITGGKECLCPTKEG